MTDTAIDALIDPLVNVDEQGRSKTDGLTVRERAFCEAGLRLIGEGQHYWKRAAAIEAGYAETNAASAAWQLMKRPNVQKYIGNALSETAMNVSVDRSYVLSKSMILLDIATGKGDLRAAKGLLEVIARHVDVGAFIPDTAPPAGQGSNVNLPFDLGALNTDEKRLLLDLITRAAARPAGESG
jgi:hypothetical protein